MGVCTPQDLSCPDGFKQSTNPPICLYPNLPTSFYNCFSCVVNGHVWVTNVTADAFSPPNIGVCFPPSAISNFSLACPMCRLGITSSIYQDIWQCPASQLASCAACTVSNFVWCSSESRCANAISSCRDRSSGITSRSRCVTSASAAALPTCAACLQQNGPLQPFEQLSQWCPERVCCGSNVTGDTTILSSVFVIKGDMFVWIRFFMCDTRDTYASGNIFFNCSANVSLSAFASGVSALAGAVSVNFGSNSFSHDGAGAVSGATVFDESSLKIETNLFHRCSAIVDSTFNKLSFRTHALAGAVCVQMGSTTLSIQNASLALLVPTPLQITNSLVSLVANNFSHCFASLVLQSCASIVSSTKGGAVLFEITPNAVTSGLSLDVLLDSSSFDSCYARWSCASNDNAFVNSAGGAFAFVSAMMPLQRAVVVSRCNFTNVSAIANFFVSSRNFAAGGGAIFMNASTPCQIVACNFDSNNISGVIVTSFADTESAGGAAIHSVNSPLITIQRCNFQSIGTSRATSAGPIVVIDRDIKQSRSTPRLVRVLESRFLSAGSRFVLVTPNFAPPGDAVAFSNSQLTASEQTSSYLTSMPSSSAFLSSNSSISCPSDSHVSVVNNSGAFKMACDTCPVLSFSYTSDTLIMDKIQQLQQHATPLDSLSLCHSSSKQSVTACPYGVVSCTGKLQVTPGLWLFFKNISDNVSSPLSYAPTLAARCPAGFCGCSNGQTESCNVLSPLDASADSALCSSNRTGVLCSRCLPGFTATINEHGCMPNNDCEEKLSWIWSVVLISYFIYGLHISASCQNDRSGIVSALLCFGQMSQFALPRLPGYSSSATASALTNIAHFDSLISSFNDACLGANMSTYRVVLMKLCGPALVLVFSFLWAWILKLYQSKSVIIPLDRSISFPGTLAQCLLLIFTSVSAAVLKLIQCVEVDGIGFMIYLDGSRKCYDNEWFALLCALVILVLLPFLFAYLLIYEKIPLAARYAVCNAYTENMYFWAAVALAARMFMSLAAALYQDIAAGYSTLLLISVIMTSLLIQFKPYKREAAYRIDLMCHICLILQYVSAIVVSASESVGVSLAATGACPSRVCTD
jgi:hypothetical protein